MTDTQSPDEEEASAEPVVIRLPVECQMSDAEHLLDQLMDIPERTPIVVDASEVESILTPAIIALVSATVSRPEDAPKIAVSSATEAFTSAFKELGLFKNLMSMEFRT